MPDPQFLSARAEWLRGLPFLAVLAFVWMLLSLGGAQATSFPLTRYVAAHTGLEIASLVLAALIFFMLLRVPRHLQQTGTMALAVTVAVSGWFDLLHAMSFQGMPDLVTPSSPEKAIAFWLAGRATMTLGLATMAVMPPQHRVASRLRRGVMAVGMAASVVVPWLVFWHLDALPRTYVPGEGLTTVKVGSEMVLAVVLMLTGLAFLRKGLRHDDQVQTSLALASLLAAVGELYFASYAQVSDLLNLMGHVAKFAAYIFLARAAFILAVRQPLRELNGLGAALQATQNPALICDAQRRITWINRAFELTSGYQLDTLRGQCLSSLDAEPGRPPSQACAAAMLAGSGWQGQVLVRRADGAFYLDERAVAPMRNLEGYLTGYVVIGDDVTERQARASASEQTAHRLQLLLDSAPDAMVVINHSGVIQLANRQVERMFGYSPDEVLGCNVKLLMADGDADRHDGHLSRHLLTGVTHIIGVGRDVKARHRSGRIFDVHLTVGRTDAPGDPQFIGFMRDISERIAAQSLLADRERRYRTLIDTAQDGVWIVAEDGRLVAANAAYAQMSGYSIEELTRMRVEDLEASEDLAAVADHIQRVRTTGRDVFETTHRCRDGRVWPAEVSVTFWPEDKGQLFVFIRDLTQRRAAEVALRLSQERFQLALRGTNDGLWDRDLVADTIYFSPRWKSMLGYGDEELANHRSTFARLIHPDDALRVHMLLRDVTDNDDTERFDIELRLRHKDGHWVSVLSRGQVLRDAAGRAVRLIGTHQDLTDRLLAERALRESEQKLRKLFDLSPVGIALCTLDGRLLEFNEAYRSLFGHSAERLRQLTYWDLTPSEYMTRENEQIELLSSRGRYGPYEKEYRRADGSLIPVRLNGVMLQLDGQPHIWSIVEDLTETRRAQREHEAFQRQQQQSQKLEALGHLTGGVAHDFNNMLTGIMGLAALGLERHVTDVDGKLATYLREIVRTSERGRDLVAKMLAYARTEENVTALPQAIGPLIEELTTMLDKSIPSGIELSCRVAPDLPPVRVAPVDVHQVVMNLVINARDAIGEHGRIGVDVSLRESVAERCSICGELIGGRNLAIAVRDTGSGIPPDILPKIFDPFFTTKEVGKGTGLGLASVQGIVHKAGGHFLVSSSRHGTTMTVLLPAAEGLAAEVDTQPAALAPVASLPQPLVWVVDDDPAVLVYLTELLAEHGCRVRAFANPREVLQVLSGVTSLPQVLITDQTMPGLSGGDLARAVLQRHPELPIILCTGYSEHMDESRARDIGIRQFLRKPFVASELLGAVQAAGAHLG